MSFAISVSDLPVASSSVIRSAQVIMTAQPTGFCRPRQQNPVTEFCNPCGMIKTVGDRILEEMKAKGIERPDLAKRSGVGYSSLSEIIRGGMKSSTKLPAIADALQVTATWLSTGKGVKETPAAYEVDWSDVRAYAQAAGLGTGVEATEYAESHKLKFKASSLRRKGLQPARLAVFYGKGDSMLPRIHGGDAILFDTGDTRPIDGAIFVIMWKGEYYAKRAELLEDVVFFRTDNPVGDHNWSKPKRMDAKRDPIEIIGRVRWIGSWED